MPKIIFPKSLHDLPADQMRITLPTLLTIVRLLLVPVVIGSMLMQQWGIAFGLFAISTVTDFLDGMLARRLNQKTFLGACLDPIADKLLLISCFATLTFAQSPLFVIPIWFLSVVLFKELLLVSGVVWLVIKRGYIKIEPTRLGKTTAVVQMGFIMWLFSCYFFNWVPIKTYYTMLSLLLCLSCISLVEYTLIGYNYFVGE